MAVHTGPKTHAGGCQAGLSRARYHADVGRVPMPPTTAAATTGGTVRLR